MSQHFLSAISQWAIFVLNMMKRKRTIAIYIHIKNLNIRFIHAEIILLSACNTAYANESYNETLSGLASSFLAAGAKSLLVSNWAIDSQTTSRLTLEVFKNLINSETTTPAIALKNAMIKIRKAGLAHPFYWSSITYAGR